jgi:outer membrane lipoprotein-sorting protein
MLAWAKTTAFLLLAPMTWTESLASIEAASRNVHSVSAEFTQTKHLKMLKRPITSEGKLYYHRPAEFRWEYTSPIKSILVKNKQGIARVTFRGGKFEPDAEAKLKPVQLVLEQMEQWLRGDFSQSTLFAAALETGEPGSPARVKLTPREASLRQFIQVVYVVMSSTPGVVDSIEIRENADGVTRLQLKNVKLNQPLPAHIFEVQ